jgi:MFS family permease
MLVALADRRRPSPWCEPGSALPAAGGFPSEVGDGFIADGVAAGDCEIANADWPRCGLGLCSGGKARNSRRNEPAGSGTMSADGPASGPGEWRRHGLLLAPCTAGIVLCAVHGYSVGVMIGPLEREFGWSRAEISSGLLIISMVALFLAPFAGLAVDKLGPRRIALVGVPLYCAALASLSLATSSIAMWWLLWVFLALTNMLVLPTVWTAAINSYFEKNRGKALAIALAGTGVAAALIPPLTNALVGMYGWRGAYVALAAIMLTAVFPLVLLLFHGAADRARAARRGGVVTATAAPLPGTPLREAFRSPRFAKLAGGALVFSIVAAALTYNAVPIVIAQGLTPTAAAGIAALVGLGSVIGRLVGGVLLDRYNARYVAGFGVLLPLVPIAILLGFKGSPEAASVACFILGLSVGLEVDGCAYLAARHFGMRSFGTMFGSINGLLLFGSGIAPIVANAVFDATRSYDLFMWGAIPMFFIASALWLSLGPYPEFPAVDEEEALPEVAPA